MTHPSIPAMLRATAEARADGVAVVDGDVRLTWAELLAALARVRGGPGGVGHRGRRPGRDVGAERLAVDRRRARPVPGRRRARAGQHPLQGGRGRRHPRPQRRQGPGDDPDLPRHRLRRDARREPASTCPRCSTTIVAEGTAWDGVRRPGDARGGAPRSTGAARRSGPDDVVRHPLHLGHHRRAEGRRDDPRPHALRRHRLGGDGRASPPTTATSWSTRTSTCSG